MSTPRQQNSPSGTPPGQGATAAPPKPAKPVRKLGDYELLGKLGQGAMGAVYLARQISQDRKVALKILPTDMAKDEEFLERFRREARAASKLSHPNIVAAYDVGVADNYHYIAMEYVDGSDLETLLTNKGRFEEAELLKIALDIASALEAAAAKGIVHRDLKPSNVLLSKDGVAKVIDLGLSSASQGDRRVTMAGFAVGTPYYISPEQARGTLDVDCRADIYSLGATLYHLSTGKLPFPGTNPVVIMTQHISEYPKAPHERNPAVSRHVSALIMKMLSKELKDRHQTPSDLKADIERCQRGELPAGKAPPAAVEKEKKKGTAGPPPPPTTQTAAHSDTQITAARWDDRLIRAINRLLSFAPPMWRVPIAAVGATLLFLIALMSFILLLRA